MDHHDDTHDHDHGHDHPHDHDDGLVPLRTPQEISRRDALRLMGSGLALAAGGCLKPPGEEIRPYVRTPPELAPGKPLFYATSMVIDGYATGLLAEAHLGRPTKLEGNPEHPASLGATNAQHQASIFDLYDPHRAKTVTSRGVPTSWGRLFETLRARPPGPLWLVLPPQSSPLVASLLARVRERSPDTHVVFQGALGQRQAYQGAELVFGRALETRWDLTRADVVLSLDADFLAAMPGSVRHARDFARRRRLASPFDRASRVHVAEPMLTPTGSLADHRLAVPAGDVLPLATAILAELARRGRPTPALPPDAVAGLERRARASAEGAAGAWIRTVAEDLARAAGASVVIPGPRQPAACHAVAHWLNLALGNLGRTVTLTEPVLLDAGRGEQLGDLAQALRARQVGAVVILETNPVYAAPTGDDLAALLAAAPLAVHYTLHEDETSAACGLVAPAAHYLEAWGDARAFDGTLSFVQPLVRPLYGTPSLPEVLAVLAGDHEPSGRQLLRELPRGGVPVDAFLARGFVPGSAAPAVAAAPGASGRLAEALVAAAAASAAAPDPAALELDLAGSPQVHDGRFASNPWLQELPHPVTKLTWGNAAMLGPRTAARLGVDDGRVLRLEVGGLHLDAPALVVAGHAEACVTLELGYGRRAPGEPIADGVGRRALALVDDEGARILPGLAVQVTGRREALARTQLHFADDGRAIALHAELAAYRRDPDFTRAHRGAPPTLLGEQAGTGPQWAMTIDTMLCSGCSACVVACDVENNVPTVGPEDVRKGRAMHWLRIDSYRFDGAETVVHQPMLCQHCEHAPCEYVCPVFATQHSPDGLNEMTYNRCIGTRFCSNNCPYKVRRFNWFDYTRGRGTLELAQNPDVTVRDRGVMEKCTYCVQRIRAAEIEARVEKRAVRPGEVVTACQQACPTGAIQFGALQHEGTEMVRWRAEPRSYAVLHHLGTRPRTLYLAKITNRSGA